MRWSMLGSFRIGGGFTVAVDTQVCAAAVGLVGAVVDGVAATGAFRGVGDVLCWFTHDAPAFRRLDVVRFRLSAGEGALRRSSRGPESNRRNTGYGPVQATNGHPAK